MSCAKQTTIRVAHRRGSAVGLGVGRLGRDATVKLTPLVAGEDPG
jgi:hypothetical protein